MYKRETVAITQSILVVSYTIYAFLYAQNNDSRGNSFLLIMSTLSMCALYIGKPSLLFIRSFIKIFCIFFGLSILTSITELGPFNHSDWIFSSASKFMFCALVVSVFTIDRFSADKIIHKVTIACCIFLSFLMIIQNSGLNIKHLLANSYLEPVDSIWNEKYHSFWLVFLAWVALFFSSFYNPKRKRIIYILIFTYTSIAIFTSYSGSAKLAWILSCCFFIISKINPKSFIKILILLIIFYIIFFPFFWQLFPASYWEWANSIYSRCFGRFLLFETASNATFDNFFLGHGFGSTLSLPIQDYLPELSYYNATLDRLANNNPSNLFPGKHPHNIVSLIWLDFGLIGAIIASFFAYRFYLWVVPVAGNQNLGPYIIALLSSALVIFSFSFSIWQTDVVLTYTFLFVSLMIMISAKDQRVMSLIKE